MVREAAGLCTVVEAPLGHTAPDDPAWAELVKAARPYGSKPWPVVLFDRAQRMLRQLIAADGINACIDPNVRTLLWMMRPELTRLADLRWWYLAAGENP